MLSDEQVSTIRYFLGQDNSGHWYCVDDRYHDQWDKWQSLNEDDERSWKVPHFAYRLDGSPSNVTFLDPEFGE